ncbi:Alpha/Beta hydrolase protein [Cantharellus anzutake]|uniref:Alpha/Beta hydrolase protein n=1 Tax=Cantharellus anzutake TaxID=1750568 RepID=UPI00190843B1|nr:Alpha/Beta hydrolase protein [Cantharellus anzutake]KAF8331359.1 Alpha/Beta hydrolase protein [Cantharellus anzutake]
MEAERRLAKLRTHKHPFKAIYLCYVICHLLFFKIPFWCLFYLPRATRPVSSWSWKTVIFTRILRWSDNFLLNAGLVNSMVRDHLPPLSVQELEQAGHSCRSVWIPPILDGDIKGEVREWKEKNGVQSDRVPGYWWGKLAPESSVVFSPVALGEKIVIHFHGGDYTMGSAFPSGPLPAALLKAWTTCQGHPLQRVLMVEYRLCRAEPLADPKNPFPTQLLDGLAAYFYVTREIGFDPKNVILSGDSAGGNLVLALARYLRDVNPSTSPGEHSDNHASLGGILLFSPWTDLCDTHMPERSPLGQDSSFVRNERTDFVQRTTPERIGMGTYGIKGYRGRAIPLGEISRNPYMSPGSLEIPRETSFEGYPRAYISTGGREILYDENMCLADRLRKGREASGKGDASEWVTVSIEPDMYHDFCFLPFTDPPEVHRECERIGNWIARC